MHSKLFTIALLFSSLFSATSMAAYNMKNLDKSLRTFRSELRATKTLEKSISKFHKMRNSVKIIRPTSSGPEYHYLNGLKMTLSYIIPNLIRQGQCQPLEAKILVDFSPGTSNISEMPKHVQHTIRTLRILCSKL